MFQFRPLPSYTYLIQYMMHEYCSCGLLHSEICVSMPAYGSTQLIAADHVLLRLPMPRHSPYALISFTFCIIEEFLLIVVFYPTIKKLILIVVTSRSYLIFYFIQFSRCIFLYSVKNTYQKINSFILWNLFLTWVSGHKWIRTIDLTLIRRAL